MKKSVLIILSIFMVLSTVLVGCSTHENNSNNNNNTEQSSTEGLDAAQNEFGMEVVEVTDDKGEKVTKKNGEVVTSEVFVEYVTDKKGNAYSVEIDENGEHVTNSKGKDVTRKTNYKVTTTKANQKDDKTEASSNSAVDPLPSQPSTEPPTASTTMKPIPEEEGTTSGELTTIKREKEKVPSTSDTGKKVKFSAEDQQTVKDLLEVPYLYLDSYENADGVPIRIATHVAIWMLQREDFNTTSYASSTVVLDLFKYFAQTVVNFKTYCNDANNENITYKTTNDTFVIKSFEAKTHTVTLQSIENLGNNNYYKVTATVSGTNKAKKVVAVIQKNRLDSSLGFSIKALKWS